MTPPPYEDPRCFVPIRGPMVPGSRTGVRRVQAGARGGPENHTTLVFRMMAVDIITMDGA